MTLRIGLVCHAGHGGSGVIASELALALAEAGHHVHLAAARMPPRLEGTTGVTVHPVESPVHPLLPHGDFTLALASRLADMTLTHGLQLLHVHYALPHAVSALLARTLVEPARRPRLITTVHGTDVLTLGLSPAFQPLIRHALQHSDAVTAPSRYLANATRTGLGLEDLPVDVIGNFVDTDRFAPTPSEARAALFPQPVQHLLAHTSTFRALKRVADVVQVLSQVRAQGLDAGLLLVGDGPERAAVERLVAQLGLGAYVTLVGERLDAATLLRQADVFLLPSELESFGLAALEAMACGVPVVASRVGGVPEVVVDGETGFLHGVGDVAAMSASTARLLRDTGLRKRLGAAAREHALNHWQRGPKVDAYLSLYRRVLGPGTPDDP